MYVYEEQRKFVFTDEGQRVFLKIRDHVLAVLQNAEFISMDRAMRVQGVRGSSWDMLACVDRMVEIGELVEIMQAKRPAGQDRIFRKAR